MSRSPRTVATFTVTMSIPKGSNVAEVAAYIRDALQSHGGGLEPSHPMFSIQPGAFTVNLKQKTTTYV
jgi:hypothetical protein